MSGFGKRVSRGVITYVRLFGSGQGAAPVYAGIVVLGKKTGWVSVFRGGRDPVLSAFSSPEIPSGERRQEPTRFRGEVFRGLAAGFAQDVCSAAPMVRVFGSLEPRIGACNADLVCKTAIWTKR